MSMTDEELVQGIRRKEETALDCLIDRYGSLIKSIVSYHLRESLRDECINDVLFSIWSHAEQYNARKNSLKNWIGAICKYKCIDYKRKYYKENFLEIDETVPSPENAESRLLKQELNREINELLSALPPLDREVFRRRYLDNQEVAEIAKSMNVTPAVLYNRLSRGRKKLKQNLIRSGRHEE